MLHNLLHRAHTFAARLAATFRRRAEAAERRIHFTRRITRRFHTLVDRSDSSDLPPATKRAALDDTHAAARTALRHLRAARYRASYQHAQSGPAPLLPLFPGYTR